MERFNNIFHHSVTCLLPIVLLGNEILNRTSNVYIRYSRGTSVRSWVILQIINERREKGCARIYTEEVYRRCMNIVIRTFYNKRKGLNRIGYGGLKGGLEGYLSTRLLYLDGQQDTLQSVEG